MASREMKLYSNFYGFMFSVGVATPALRTAAAARLWRVANIVSPVRRTVLGGIYIFLLSLSFSAIAQKKKTTSKHTEIIDKQTLVRGQKVYETVCSVCHQPDGSGVPGMNPPLIKTDWVLGDKTKLIGVVLKGLQERIEINGDSYDNIMPANDYLTDQQIADVLTFVRNSFGNKATAVKAVEVKAQRGK